MIGLCLSALVFVEARRHGWPKDTRPSWRFLGRAARAALVPMVVPLVILGGFYLGAFTATEAGAIVAFYAFIVARFYYRNVSYREMLGIAYESALLTAAVVFLLAVATIFQYLMGVTGVPAMLGRLLAPLAATHWLFLGGVAAGMAYPTTLAVIRSCKSNTSSSAPSNLSAQRCTPVSASMSWPVIRSRPQALRTLPSKT